MTKEVTPAYLGEAMLLRWNRNHKGQTVAFLLDPHMGPEHPFERYKGGEAHGQRFQLIAVAIDENDEPVSAIGPAASVSADAAPEPSMRTSGQEQDTRRTPKTRTQVAGMKIKEPAFQEWIGVAPQHLGLLHTSTESADSILKARLGIKSKKEIVDGPIGDAWDRLLATYDAQTKWGVR